MIQDNIENFKGGWFVGDFNPSLFKNFYRKYNAPTRLAI